MLTTYKDIKKAIIRSQHCQRNWDLSKEIPQEDLDLFVFATTNCPSKQNIAFYNVHVITNRDLIEKISELTQGFAYEGRTMTNSQTLANLLIIFSSNMGYGAWHKKTIDGDGDSSQTRDQQMAVGIAAGYLNLLASQLGYNTGCCACFDNQTIKNVLQTENDILLMMGIGFKDENQNRRIHHLDKTFTFPALSKEHIQVTHLS